VELADFVALADYESLVAHPVGEAVVQPALAQYAVVVGAWIADGLDPGRVPVHALGDVGDAVLVVHIEGGDALAVAPVEP
jgi:hypothetical protein